MAAFRARCLLFIAREEVAMRVYTVIDPGHGGNTPAGHSTPIGVAGPNGLLEKNVTLQIARHVAGRLGSRAALTRTGDVNVSLGERGRTAQRLGAHSFVSIHANGGGHANGYGRGARGVETWVHPGAGQNAIALAEEVRAALVRPDVPDGGLHRGDLAVLHPSMHSPDSAACLVEVDYLDHPGGARRLGDPREIASLGDSIAQAIDRYLGRREERRSYSFGRGAVARPLETGLDLTDFSDNAMVVVPDGTANRVPANITQNELDELKRAWDCMMRGVGIRLVGTADNQRAFRNLLLGGLVYSPLIRQKFIEIACDAAHPINFHVGRNQPRVWPEAFRFPGPGDHTFNLQAFEDLPNVSGNPRNFMQLRYQVLIHALTEARHGVTFGPSIPIEFHAGISHRRGIDDENAYRSEQGQIGVKDYEQPQFDVDGDLRSDLTHNGVNTLWEKWRLTQDATGAIRFVSATFSP
jgi:N-acetylmuramoyl-L-alanine amidase